MLAQNFLDASTLGISEVERDALVKVLGMLERGEMKHVEYHDTSHPNGFNMLHWSQRRSDGCGSVRCLGGWAEVVGNISLTISAMSPGLSTLFYPPLTVTYQDITTDQAATALRNYLTRGAPHWDEALAT